MRGTIISIRKRYKGGYAHQIVTRNGASIHYLYDLRTKTRLGNGIDDASWDETMDPLMQLLLHDVAVVTKSGMYGLRRLRNELFTEANTEALMQTAMFEMVDHKKPDMENVGVLAKYCMLASQKFSENQKTRERRRRENED